MSEKSAPSMAAPARPSRLRWWLGGGVSVVLLAVVIVGGYVIYNLFFFRPSQIREVEIAAPEQKEKREEEINSPVLHAFGITPTKDAKYSLKTAIEIAEKSRERYRANFRDYTTRMYRAERHSNSLVGSTVLLKVRDRREKTPFSVYLRYMKPESIAGREVIYVEDANEGNLIAHKEGIFNLVRMSLKPDGMLAMVGNKYPITMIGLENMLTQMIERGKRELKHGDCEVNVHAGHTIGEDANKRTCTLINVWHREKKPEFDFYLLQIYVDEELLIPIRYAAYTWPEKEGDDEYILQEEYSYFDLKLNVGLTDQDFDPDNEAYEFP